MATLTYSFVPDSSTSVWVIDDSACSQTSSYGCGCSSTTSPSSSAPAVREGVVVRMNAKQLINASPTVTYDVRLGNDAGTKTFEESDVYATLSAALTAYQTLLT